MNKDTDTKNPMRNFLTKQSESTDVEIPLTLFGIVQVPRDSSFPEHNECAFHKDMKYWTYPFYKPISQYSKII
jgi:hypothetical protein